MQINFYGLSYSSNPFEWISCWLIWSSLSSSNVSSCGTRSSGVIIILFVFLSYKDSALTKWLFVLKRITTKNSNILNSKLNIRNGIALLSTNKKQNKKAKNPKLNHPFIRETVIAAIGHYQMIEHFYIQQCPSRRYFFGELDVLLARL